MSMLSAQIDELRKYADRADGTFPMLASALRDAADTIWQLRDDLQRANDALRDAEHDVSCAWDRVRKAEAENAKLKELFTETLIRLAAANEAAGGGFMDAQYCELLESHGIEVD